MRQSASYRFASILIIDFQKYNYETHVNLISLLTQVYYDDNFR
jgi:hypothetical protein